MVSRVGSVIFLAAALTTLNIARCDGSDDDEPLREALLLIKLLRRTGVVSDASRERRYFSKHDAIAAPLSPDLPEPLHNVTLHDESSYNNTFRPDQKSRRSMSDGVIKSAEEQENLVKKHNDKHYRRQDYEDMFDTHPESKSTSPATTTAAPATSPTTAAPTATSQANAATTPANADSKPSKTSGSNEAKIPITTSKTQTPKIKLTFTKKTTSPGKDDNNKESERNVQQLTNTYSLNGQNKDPVISQVETELKNEMDTLPRPDKYKNKEDRKNFKATRAPSTLRIHLEGSSRYPIPYPENHALCYTNPLNGLCRTPL